MFRLELFGGISLEGPSGPLDGAILQRRPLALLSLLALAAGPLGRDVLVAYLWPESDGEHGRHRLSVVLHLIRKALGPAAVLSSGDELWLNRDRVSVDVHEYDAALEEGRASRAVELYRGPLLDGFHVKNAPRFERWVDDRQDALARSYAGALTSLAEAAEARGDLNSAVDCWSRLVEHDPYSSRIAVRLMLAFESAGDRPLALRHARAHAERLRQDLGVEPDPELIELTRRLATTDGENFPSIEPAAREEANGSAGLPGGPSEPQRYAGHATVRVLGGGGTASRPRWLRPRLAVLAAVLVVPLLVLVGTGLGRRGLSRGEVPPDRVAVLPFSVGVGEEVTDLARGIGELLSHSLNGAGALRTVDHGAVLAVMPGPPALANHTPEEVADRVGAGLYVAGSISEMDGRVRLHARLHDPTAGGRLLAEAEIEGEAERLFDLVDAVARDLLIGREAGPSGDLPRLAARTTESLPALKHYLRGETALRDGYVHAAMGAFTDAVEEDSSFALAHYRLAVNATLAWELRTAHRAAAAAVRHAGRLAPGDRELLAAFHAYLLGDAERAERGYREVIGRQAANLEAWLMLGEVQARYNAYRGRSWREALDAFGHALALDSDNRRAIGWFFNAALQDRDLESADSLLRLTVTPDGYTRWRNAPLGLHLWDRQRELDVAIDRRRAQPHFSIDRGVNNLVLGLTRLDPARRMARLLVEDDAPAIWRAAGHVRLAELWMAGGRPEAAADATEAASALGYDRVLEFEARMSTLPFHPARRDRLEALRLRLELWAADTDPALPPGMTEPLDDAIRPYLRSYYLGLMSALLGDAEGALGYARDLEGVAGPSETTALASDLSRGVRAQVLRQEGRDEEALAELEAARLTAPWHMASESPHYGRVRERYMKADLLFDLGRPDEALFWFEGLALDRMAVSYRAPSHLRQAGIYEQLGRLDLAMAHYGRVVELLEGCEPALEPMLQLARDAQRRLAVILPAR